MFYCIKKKRGISLIEVLIGASIISFILIGSVSVIQSYLVLSRLNLDRVQAAYLLEGGVEITRHIRDANYSNITSLTEGTPYYLVLNSGVWATTTTKTLFDNKFERTMIVDSVYRRDSDNDIVDVSSGDPKTLDPNTKEITLNVSWGTREVKDVSFETGTTQADLANFPSNDSGDGDPAQEITTGSDAIKVPKIELFLMRAPTTVPSDVFLEIRSGSTVGSVVATSDTVQVNALSDLSLSWIAFNFSSAPTLTPTTNYYLRLRSDPDSTIAFSGSEGTLYWGYEQSGVSGPYSGGEAYRYVGRLGNTADTGQVLSDYDFSFRVFSEQVGNSIEAVTYMTDLFTD